jgi:hypothetical protein
MSHDRVLHFGCVVIVPTVLKARSTKQAERESFKTIPPTATASPTKKENTRASASPEVTKMNIKRYVTDAAASVTRILASQAGEEVLQKLRAEIQKMVAGEGLDEDDRATLQGCLKLIDKQIGEPSDDETSDAPKEKQDPDDQARRQMMANRMQPLAAGVRRTAGSMQFGYFRPTENRGGR